MLSPGSRRGSRTAGVQPVAAAKNEETARHLWEVSEPLRVRAAALGRDLKLRRGTGSFAGRRAGSRG
jgi:hypothetical protein